MLLTSDVWFTSAWNPALSGIGTLWSLVELLKWQSCRNGIARDSARTAQYDWVLRRECAFSGGFMTDLGKHMFGENLSSRSYGHAGLGSTVFCFAEPDLELFVSVGVCTIADSNSSVYLQRSRLVDAVLGDVGEL